jgi:hypothetical protein
MYFILWKENVKTELFKITNSFKAGKQDNAKWKVNLKLTTRYIAIAFFHQKLSCSIDTFSYENLLLIIVIHLFIMVINSCTRTQYCPVSLVGRTLAWKSGDLDTIFERCRSLSLSQWLITKFFLRSFALYFFRHFR